MKLSFFKTLAALLIVLAIVSTFAAIFGFHKGQAVAEERNRALVSEAQERVEQAVAASNAASAQVTHVYQDRVKVVKDVQVVVQERIKEVERVVNTQCNVPTDAISILNAAAKGPL